ncbi:AAA family ATPase [Methylocystis sp. H4A]|nr:AAA family ATPase [Methylocystis sp. H4A]MBG0801483.1 AAA family ATPase [Methylocystis sp. H4A]MBG0802019.1 AAA family ATPase [Methylocystis sp. H4A]
MIVIVCGLSGSGKSSLTKNSDFLSLGFVLVRASDLLRSAGLPTTQLRARDALLNQEYLIDKISDLAAERAFIVLDGHLLIETIDGPQLVPDTIVSRLPVSYILFVDTSPKEIMKRRARENGVCVDELSDLGELEHIHARRLARKGRVPFGSIKDGDVVAFDLILKGLLGGSD